MLKITKLKPYAIHFKNKHNNKFLIHIAEDGYEQLLQLFKVNLNEYGNYTLDIIDSDFVSFLYMQPRTYKIGITEINWKRTTTYKHLGDVWLKKLIIEHFGEDVLSDIAKENNNE